MSTTALAFVGLWLLCGLAIALVMHRLGHSLGKWVILAFMGPLLALFAMSEQEQESEAVPKPLREGEAKADGAKVLVGIDGSDESRTALETVISLFGGTLGRITLASVIDYETALYPDTSDKPEMQARHLLDRARAHLRSEYDVNAFTVLLTGEPALALVEQARREGDEVIVVGSRGRGLSKKLLGSVATRLAQGSTVPVLMVGDQGMTSSMSDSSESAASASETVDSSGPEVSIDLAADQGSTT